MDRRQPAETIVERLVDGGSVALTGRRAADRTWAFEVVADEATRRAYFDEGGTARRVARPNGAVASQSSTAYAWASACDSLRAVDGRTEAAF